MCRAHSRSPTQDSTHRQQPRQQRVGECELLITPCPMEHLHRNLALHVIRRTQGAADAFRQLRSAPVAGLPTPHPRRRHAQHASRGGRAAAACRATHLMPMGQKYSAVAAVPNAPAQVQLRKGSSQGAMSKVPLLPQDRAEAADTWRSRARSEVPPLSAAAVSAC